MTSHYVLVTGGAGFIGSTTCKALKKAGFIPVVLDNLSTGYGDFVKWGPFIKADVSDKDALDYCFSTYSPVAVLHFASFINVGESVFNPDKYFENNLMKTFQFLSHLKQYAVPVVFSSTAAVYGEPETDVLKETHPKNPLNPYGKSKFFIEHILDDFEKAYGMRSVIFRYFNAAGSDPVGEVGESHQPETHLIPLALQAAMVPEKPLHIFGNDYPTPDGTCVRDYVHVTDLADAHVRAVSYLLGNNPSLRVNLGNGQGFSVKQVVDTVSAVLNTPVPVVYAPRRDGDPAKLVADSLLARQVLGWEPQYPDLETIVDHAWKWALLKQKH